MPNGQQAIIWTNDNPVQSCIYAALGGDELDVFVKQISDIDIYSKFTHGLMSQDHFDD